MSVPRRKALYLDSNIIIRLVESLFVSSDLRVQLPLEMTRLDAADIRDVDRWS